jgi:hypothetical protein
MASFAALTSTSKAGSDSTLRGSHASVPIAQNYQNECLTEDFSGCNLIRGANDCAKGFLQLSFNDVLFCDLLVRR